MHLPTITPKDFETSSNEHEVLQRVLPVLYYSKGESAFVKVASSESVSEYLSNKTGKMVVKEPSISDLKERGVTCSIDSLGSKFIPVSGQEMGDSGAYVYITNPEVALLKSPVDAVLVNSESKSVEPEVVLAGNYIQRFADGTLGVVTEDEYVRIFRKDIQKVIEVEVEPNASKDLDNLSQQYEKLIELRSQRMGVSKEEYLDKIGLQKKEEDISPGM